MCNEIATANVAFLHAHVSEPLLTMMSYDDDIIRLTSFFLGYKSDSGRDNISFQIFIF